MAKKPARSTANDATVAHPLAVSKPRGSTTDEEIRARAYEMYLERGGHHGLDLDDWVRAERELKKRQ